MVFYLGLISGTSMDAIDAALVDFDAAPLRIIATGATAFAPALKRRITALIDQAGSVALDEVGEIDVELGRAFAQAALALLRSAGVDISRVAAIGSHGQTLRHRPDLPAPFSWQIGDPNTQMEMLREISPLFHADKITKPLIVLQGANDPRVIKPESDEIVDAIKKKNGVVEYVVFDNEGHGFSKRANEIRGNKAILDFLDKYLKATAVAGTN